MTAGRLVFEAVNAALLAFVHAAELAPRPWSALLDGGTEVLSLLRRSDRALAAAGVPAASIARLRHGSYPPSWDRWLAQPAHHLLPLGSPHYPPRLAAAPDPPVALWVAGSRLELLSAPQIAIVGSRQATRGGIDIAHAFAHRLSMHGLTVTSGLALGIDGASHEAALTGLGGTIAVLGSGIDTIYPRAHLALAREIERLGLLVSEHGPGAPARALHFPRRNRIIAGLAHGTLVIEASRRSGSLITARIANEIGREVFAVPGSIHNPLARGCHALLRQGARLVEDADEILAELAPIIGIAPSANACTGQDTHVPGLDTKEDFVIECLGFEPIAFDMLVEKAALTAAELSSMLAVLELEGLVEALPGGRYSRRAKRG